MKADIRKYLTGEELVLQSRQLAVDINREYGQVRQLSMERVKQRKTDLLANQPGRLIRLNVWQEPGFLPRSSSTSIFLSTVGKQYYILSGQHIFSACVEIAREMVRDRILPPAWFTSR